MLIARVDGYHFFTWIFIALFSSAVCYSARLQLLLHMQLVYLHFFLLLLQAKSCYCCFNSQLSKLHNIASKLSMLQSFYKKGCLPSSTTQIIYLFLVQVHTAGGSHIALPVSQARKRYDLMHPGVHFLYFLFHLVAFCLIFALPGPPFSEHKQPKE